MEHMIRHRLYLRSAVLKMYCGGFINQKPYTLDLKSNASDWGPLMYSAAQMPSPHDTSWCPLQIEEEDSHAAASGKDAPGADAQGRDAEGPPCADSAVTAGGALSQVRGW